MFLKLARCEVFQNPSPLFLPGSIKWPPLNRVLENCRAFRVWGCTEAPLVTVGFIDEAEEELAANTDGFVNNWDVRVIDDRAALAG
ncbi:hypothetical protein G8764_17980 [Pseudomaricurvus alcaniphilus]|uniref:hypothetical protein n=1 Tax=Pseudomaricurvus alcaniphilus TaxID=1166482 RepID=UPI00140C72E8|nr:hypothetical protein [Pseudomaricurvus alcaniphilus]NHN39199.1 hypothetical protein [Pseudomaricurvus alcaniphilus]